MPTLHLVQPGEKVWRCMDCGVALKGRAVFCHPCYEKRRPALEARWAREAANPRPMELDPPEVLAFGQDYGEPDYSRAVCLDQWCPWFAESRGEDDSLRFRAETHYLETGHRVGYWWHTDILRDMGDDPDEVIPSPSDPIFTQRSPTPMSVSTEPAEQSLEEWLADDTVITFRSHIQAKCMEPGCPFFQKVLGGEAEETIVLDLVGAHKMEHPEHQVGYWDGWGGEWNWETMSVEEPPASSTMGEVEAAGTGEAPA